MAFLSQAAKNQLLLPSSLNILNKDVSLGFIGSEGLQFKADQKEISSLAAVC